MPSDSMRAVQCPGPNQLEQVRVAVPEPGPGEVRLRVAACGICGSDLRLLPFGYMGQCVVPGHEMTGEIDALGDGVAGLNTGDTAVVEPLRCCGNCPPCLRGQHALCAAGQIFGVHVDGGFAEFACVPMRRIYPIASRVPAPLAALAEPLAVTVHGLDRGHVSGESKLLVLGAGTLGLLSTLAACDRGAEVWISARYPHQAEIARAFGATRVLSENESSLEGLNALRSEIDFDCVLECVGGGADTLPLAAAAVAPGGHISVLGLFTEPIELHPGPLFLKEVTLAWSNCYQQSQAPTDFAEAVRLIEAHTNRLAPMATHQVALDEIEQGFALAGDRRSGAVKVSVLL